jgi:8-hydroxy-5-deazaflavin:NADPH oxidoreductase
MRIGIIGTGNMGRTLGLLWAEQGHDLFFGSTDPDKGLSVASMAKGRAQGGTYDDAAAFGDLIFYSLRDSVPSKALRSKAVLDGKIIIDPNNRAIPEGFAYGPLMAESIAEQLQGDVPKAHVVKAFNTLAQEVFEIPAADLRKFNTAIFIAGDDPHARLQVGSLAEAMGFSAVDCGNLRNARMLEALADFTRYLIMGKQLGAFTTLAVNVLPPPQKLSFGGRQASKLY